MQNQLMVVNVLMLTMELRGVVEEKAATLVVLLAGEETFVSDARAG